MLMLTESCPHHEEARAIIDQAIADTGVEAEVKLWVVKA